MILYLKFRYVWSTFFQIILYKQIKKMQADIAIKKRKNRPGLETEAPAPVLSNSVGSNGSSDYLRDEIDTSDEEVNKSTK